MLNISVVSFALKADDNAELKKCAETVLDEQETLRFQKFKYEKPALTFVAGRLLVKSALARELQCDVTDITLVLSENGKPALINSEWHFSISHAQNTVVVALAKCPLGVDLESPQRFKPEMLTNPRFFSPPLVADLATRENAKLVAAKYWTAMEAIVKLEDSSIFSERIQFTMLLNKQNEYPYQRNLAIVNWLESKDLVGALVFAMPEREALNIQFTELNSDLSVEKATPVKKDIIAHTEALQIK